MPHLEAERCPTPVLFFSHGSTMMLGEESSVAELWEKAGREAVANGVQHIVIMGAHWETSGDAIQVATNPNPRKAPVAFVDPAKWAKYKLYADPEMGKRVVGMLNDAGFKAEEAPKYNWIHDIFLVIIRMFPYGNHPPTTVLSVNARYDPHYHMKVGAVLRPLRYENTLLIGSGGAVHNLYRNNWSQMVLYRDNFSQPRPPADWAVEFRQSVQDVFLGNSGPKLRRAMTRLMEHPRYRDAHGSDEHFMPALFVAGAAGDYEDAGKKHSMTAEVWELVNMCNSQYQLGEW